MSCYGSILYFNILLFFFINIMDLQLYKVNATVKIFYFNIKIDLKLRNDIAKKKYFCLPEFRASVNKKHCLYSI